MFVKAYLRAKLAADIILETSVILKNLINISNIDFWSPLATNFRQRLEESPVDSSIATFSCWLIDGSLLGAVRNQGMLPWDYDGDIGVLWADRKEIEANVLPALNTSGIQFANIEQGTYRLFYEKISVDIFAYNVSEGNDGEGKKIFPSVTPKDNYYKIFGCNDIFQYEFFFPLRSCNFENVVLNCPNRPNDLLNNRYCFTFRFKISFPYKIDCFRFSNLRKVFLTS